MFILFLYRIRAIYARSLYAAWNLLSMGNMSPERTKAVRPQSAFHLRGKLWLSPSPQGHSALQMFVFWCCIFYWEIMIDFGPTTCGQPVTHPQVSVTFCVFVRITLLQCVITKRSSIFLFDHSQIGCGRLARFIPPIMHVWILTIASGHDVLGIDEFLSWLNCMFFYFISRWWLYFYVIQRWSLECSCAIFHS